MLYQPSTVQTTAYPATTNLYDALLHNFPQHQYEISQLYNDYTRKSSNPVFYSGITQQQVPAHTSGYIHTQQVLGANSPDLVSDFAGFMHKIKSLIGGEAFLSFINYYLNKVPEHNEQIKQELSKLELEALQLEAQEKDKFKTYGSQLSGAAAALLDSRETGHPLFCHSSLERNIQEEFKDAQWVVLTNPIIVPKKGQGNETGAKASTSSSQSLNTSFTIQLSNLGSNSLRQQSTTSASLAAQAKIAQNQAPQKRYGHSACLVKNKLYVFGGLASQQKGGNMQTFHECTLKFASQGEDTHSNVLFSWDKIKGDAPRARDSHTCVHAGDALLMFGGSGGTNSFNDLYKFDIKSQKWSKLEPLGDVPPPREGHIAKLLGKDKMIVHGGVDQNETSFDDTYVLSGINQYIDNSQISSIYTALIPGYSYYDMKNQQQVSDFQSGCLQEGDSGSSNLQQTSNFFGIQNQESQSIGYMGMIETKPATPGNSVIQIPAYTRSEQSQSKALASKLRWNKCINRGPVPQGRDSHTCALINNKLYIFGGQGDGDVIFDDLYSLEIIDEPAKSGEPLVIAQWQVIDNQTLPGQKAQYPKPRARTSHSCTVYKNRYMIIIGGEGELTEEELQREQRMSRSKPGPKKKPNERLQHQQSMNAEDESIFVDLEESVASDTAEQHRRHQDLGHSAEIQDTSVRETDNKRPLNDVWVYDTILNQWHEIKPSLRIQGSTQGKKVKKEFEPRMAHTAVQHNQFVILFGGLSTNNQLVSNDLYVLSLDGNIGGISQAFENEEKASTQKQQQIKQEFVSTTQPPIVQQLPDQMMMPINQFSQLERSRSTTQLPDRSIASQSKGGSSKVTLRVPNPEDRRIMSGQIVNQIINYNQGHTHQYFINPPTTPAPSSQVLLNQPSILQSQASSMMKCDTYIQTTSKDEQEQDNRVDNKQQVIAIIKQGDYRLSSFQRTKFSFIKSLAEEIAWPLQCIGALIDNSVESFNLALLKFESQKQQQILGHVSLQAQRFNQPLDIEINLINPEEDGKYSSQCYIEYKDNSIGIHPKQLMEALTTFGHSNLKQKVKSDYLFSEHGIGMKLNCLRLAQTTLIITKTKPYYDCGTANQYISIGLLSTEFIKKSSSINGFLVAPIVSFEIKNKRISKPLTPEPDHFLNMIAQFTRVKFDSGDRILQYALNIIPEQGGTHIYMVNLHKEKLSKSSPDLSELTASKDNADIQLNNQLFKEYTNDLLENSLQKYINFLYIEHPTWLNITINKRKVILSNPYSYLKANFPNTFYLDKQEKFALQKIDTSSLYNEINQQISKLNAIKDEESKSTHQEGITTTLTSEVLEESLRQLNNLQGVLIYRGNRLIRRIECPFGQNEDELKSQRIKNQHAIVSVFKSKSQTTMDKADFQEKSIIKNIKQVMAGTQRTNQ